MRLFAAVVPPDEVLEDLDEFLAPRRAAADFRWSVPDQWHLTLAFMPAVADRHLDDLVERLARAGRRRTPFGLRVAGGGAFPNPARARVLWAGPGRDERARHRARAGSPPEPGAASRPGPAASPRVDASRRT